MSLSLSESNLKFATCNTVPLLPAIFCNSLLAILGPIPIAIIFTPASWDQTNGVGNLRRSPSQNGIIQMHLITNISSHKRHTPGAWPGFFKGGDHTVSKWGYSPDCHYGQDIVMAFSPHLVGCLVKKGLQKWGSRAPQDPPGYALGTVPFKVKHARWRRGI